MWLAYIELSDNKLSNKKLSNNRDFASEFTGKLFFLKPITIGEIVIFMNSMII